MSSSKFSFGLRFRHASADSDSICRVVGLRPFAARDVGKPKASRNGTPLGGENSATYVSFHLQDDVRIDIEEQIETWLRYLIERSAEISLLLGSGGSGEFWVNVFPGEATGFTLSPTHLRQFAELGISLAFAAYPGD